jgi:hypothetical protein
LRRNWSRCNQPYSCPQHARHSGAGTDAHHPDPFAIVADPVGSGFVTSFSRPGGSATGFTTLEPTMAGKWLELLKEIAPRVIRAALLLNPATMPSIENFLSSFNAAAASLAVEGIHSAAAPFQMPGRPPEDRLPYRRSSSAPGHSERLQPELLCPRAGHFWRPVKIAARYGIKVHYQHNLVAVDGPMKTATFEKVSEQNKGERITVPFDMLHVSPPQSPPDEIKSSPLVNAAGWVKVNQNSMQHVRYPNVFSLGDVNSTANSKTAAAVRKQAPVVVDNIVH